MHCISPVYSLLDLSLKMYPDKIHYVKPQKYFNTKVFPIKISQIAVYIMCVLMRAYIYVQIYVYVFV